MSAKAGWQYALLLSVLGACRVAAQDPSLPMPAPPESPDTATDTLPASAGPPVRVSNWLTHARPDCCGPLCNGPITYELYARTGPSLPFGGSFLADQLDSGWFVEGGGRSLYFNTYRDAAWVVDLGISYQYNHAGNPATFDLGTTPSHVAALHRTFVNLGFGQELYLTKAADAGGINWRVGWDVGGRYGSTRLDVYNNGTNLLNRLPDTIGAAYASLHTDVELPCGCCTFLGGFRAEWSYTWQDVLLEPSRELSDIQDINFLLNFGVRF